MRILVMLMLLWTTALYAEHNGIQPDEKQLPMSCGDTEHLLDGLKETYTEEIVMMSAGVNGVGHELFHSLWINAGSRTWTFLVVNKDVGVTCIIASGDNFKMFFPGGDGI
jgi:hypothetical protein